MQDDIGEGLTKLSWVACFNDITNNDYIIPEKIISESIITIKKI